MVCHECKFELPVYAKYCPNCGAQAHVPHIHHDVDASKGAEVKARANRLGQRLEPAYHRIQNRLDDARVDKSELYDMVRRIEAEAALGGAANPEKIGRWLKTLSDLAPDVQEPVTAALQAEAAAG